MDPRPQVSAQPPHDPHEPMPLSALATIVERLTAALPQTPRPRSEAVLHRLTEAAVASVPGAGHATLILFRDGRAQCLAPRGPQVADIAGLENRAGEGPCADTCALETGGAIVVEDFTSETRWPRFSPAAAEAGIRSMLSLAMAPPTSGALALYATGPHAFGESSRSTASAFALAAAVALDGSTSVAELERAVQSRDVIGQAKGILIERFGLDAEEAFERLVDSSQRTNMKLVDVAHWLVSETATTTTATTTTRTTTMETTTRTTTRTTTHRSPEPGRARS